MSKIIDFIIDSLNASRERLKLSIATFYITILALYHWRAFAILFFGGIPMMKKIEAIDQLYKNYTFWFYLLNPLCILLVSITFMILFPTIMWLSEKILVQLSINRKENKKREDIADRNKELETVRHLFKLKQEETGNLQENQYLNKIKNLEVLVQDNLEDKMALEKELQNERKNQNDAIFNLKRGFENVENSYRQQIIELNRQLEIISDNDSATFNPFNSKNIHPAFRNNLNPNTLQELQNDFYLLNNRGKDFILDIMSYLNQYPNIEDKTFIYKNSTRITGKSYSLLLNIVFSLLKMRVFETINDDESHISVTINANALQKHFGL